MDAIILQILNGLDKGSAYALIALGLTLIFGTLGVELRARCAICNRSVLRRYIEPNFFDQLCDHRSDESGFFGQSSHDQNHVFGTLVRRRSGCLDDRLVSAFGNLTGHSHHAVGRRDYGTWLD